MAENGPWKASHVQYVQGLIVPFTPAQVQCLIGLEGDELGVAGLQMLVCNVGTVSFANQHVISYYPTGTGDGSSGSTRMFYTVVDDEVDSITVGVDRFVAELSLFRPQELIGRYDGTLAACELQELRRLLAGAAVIEGEHGDRTWYLGPSTEQFLASWDPGSREMRIEWPPVEYTSRHGFRIRWRNADEDFVGLGNPVDESYLYPER